MKQEGKMLILLPKVLGLALVTLQFGENYIYLSEENLSVAT